MSDTSSAIAKPKEKSLLIYDGDCPACRFYCQGLEVGGDEAGGVKAADVELVDFRKDDSWKADLTLNCDPDKTMLLVRGNEVYQGGDALHQLTKVSAHRSGFVRALALVFRSRGLSRLSYPALRFIRDILVKSSRIIKRKPSR
ncbi:MAG: DUF393 domain-containing protein [Porticoccaceae bacterium]|nr:DUF393 domain-containing protein [Porticoccaceae bacterium]